MKRVLITGITRQARLIGARKPERIEPLATSIDGARAIVAERFDGDQRA